VEVHYYVLFVVFWAIRHRFGSKAFTIITVAITAVTMLLAVTIASRGPVNTAFLIFWAPFFVLGTLSGASGAAGVRRLQALHHRWRIVATPLAILLVIPGVRRLFDVGGVGAWCDPWVWSGVLAIAVLASCEPSVRQALSGRAPQWVGGVSFSLYLFHPPCIRLMMEIFGGGSVVSATIGSAATIALSLAVAGASHRCVERPSRAFFRRLGRYAG
jgi:peptidoglycan/LPS O-acetylase OafA/YrhL